jgi:glyceraldehyde-3-phosphate dehydrogenase type I
MIKIAINGFGRIGRSVFKRIIENHPDLEVSAINDLTDNKTLAHLLKYDSIYGRYEKEIGSNESSISVNQKKFPVFAERDPKKLPWEKLGIDIVLECTGIFRDLDGARKHIKAGAKKVIISAPSKSGNAIPSYVMGVNESKFSPKKDQIIDMGSCTTNCIAPLVKILNDNFTIEKGFMSTIHSYTTDQRILDLPHKDLRRARAAAINIVPTTTGAAKALGKVIPEVNNKIDGIAIRVPTPIVSLLDLVVKVKKSTKTQEVNKILKKAEIQKNFKGILRTEIEPLVSSDYIGDSYSSIVDLSQTMVNGNLIKVVSWYDNEFGYSARLAELAEFIGKKL